MTRKHKLWALMPALPRDLLVASVCQYENARHTVAFYGQMAQYEAYYEYIGFGTEARAMQAAGARQEHAALMAACSDAMVESIVLAGTPDKAAYYAQRIAEVFYG